MAHSYSEDEAFSVCANVLDTMIEGAKGLNATSERRERRELLDRAAQVGTGTPRPA